MLFLSWIRHGTKEVLTDSSSCSFLTSTRPLCSGLLPAVTLSYFYSNMFCTLTSVWCSSSAPSAILSFSLSRAWSSLISFFDTSQKTLILSCSDTRVYLAILNSQEHQRPTARKRKFSIPILQVLSCRGEKSHVGRIHLIPETLNLGFFAYLHVFSFNYIAFHYKEEKLKGKITIWKATNCTLKEKK